MNTPKPCDKCEHLYVNILCQNDPSYLAECLKGKQVKQRSFCYEFINWKRKKY